GEVKFDRQVTAFDIARFKSTRMQTVDAAEVVAKRSDESTASIARHTADWTRTVGGVIQQGQLSSCHEIIASQLPTAAFTLRTHTTVTKSSIAILARRPTAAIFAISIRLQISLRLVPLSNARKMS